MRKIGQEKSDKITLDGFVILLLDSRPVSVSLFKAGLVRQGASVRIFDRFDESVYSLHDIHAVIVDIRLVDDKLLDYLQKFKYDNPDGRIYVTFDREYNRVTIDSEISGVSIDDYLQKPIDPDRFGTLLSHSIRHDFGLERALVTTEPLINRVRPFFQFRSVSMRKALANLHEIAASSQTVLITGETGSGKEIIARAIHAMSPRVHGHFVPVNCGAIPQGLIEGELFGHEKGAFTGAVRMRKGKFELADGGTLFLDEIGDMPLNLQTSLLRALEDGYVYRVGGEEMVPINIRIISATRVNLRKAVMDNLFREDLYYRLNVLSLHIPPLRERVEDISYLALFFLEHAFAELGRPHPYPTLSPETIYILETQRWQGNVRELRNVMTRVATLLPKNITQVLPIHILPNLDAEEAVIADRRYGLKGVGSFVIDSIEPLDYVEREYIEHVLRQTDGNRSQAARILGLNLRTLRRKLNIYANRRG